MRFNVKERWRKVLPLSAHLSLFLALISLILWTYLTLRIYPIHVDSNDFLGLTFKLPLLYWVGLGSVVISGLLTLVGEREPKDKWVFCIATIFALYLFATPILGEANPRIPWSYYPSSETLYILSEAKIDPASPRPLISYHYLPGFHFLSGSLLLITGLNLEFILKYAQLFLVECFLTSIFFVTKQLCFSQRHSLLMIFTFLASFWVPWYYYCPFAFSLVLLTLAFALLMHLSLSRQSFILITLLSVGMILFHSLTSIAFLLSLLTVFLLKRQRKLKLITLTVGICLFAWYIYLTPLAFRIGVIKFVTEIPALDILSYYGPTTKFVGGGIQQQVVNYFRLSFAITLASAFLLSFFLLIARRAKDNWAVGYRTKILAWMIGPTVLIFLRYGVEIFERAYTLLLIPTLAFVLLNIKSKKNIVALLLILIFLHIPAHYGSESFDTVFTSDLNGSKFIANNVSFDNSILYPFWHYVYFYDSANYRPFKAFHIWKGPEYRIIEVSEYIVDSEQTRNLYFYYFDFNPLDKLETRIGNNLIFNNGQFRLIKNQTFVTRD